MECDYEVHLLNSWLTASLTSSACRRGTRAQVDCTWASSAEAGMLHTPQQINTAVACGLWCWGWNPGPYACEASALPLSPSLVHRIAGVFFMGQSFKKCLERGKFKIKQHSVCIPELPSLM